MTKATMDNLAMRKGLAETFDKLISGQIKPEMANSVAEVCRTQIKQEVATMNYQLQRGEKPFSTFFTREIEPTA